MHTSLHTLIIITSDHYLLMTILLTMSLNLTSLVHISRYEIMKYLWELPRHRQKFTELATEALSNMECARPPLFLRFVNLLINDAIYLLDEGLSYMSQLRESQKERCVYDYLVIV